MSEVAVHTKKISLEDLCDLVKGIGVLDHNVIEERNEVKERVLVILKKTWKEASAGLYYGNAKLFRELCDSQDINDFGLVNAEQVFAGKGVSEIFKRKVKDGYEKTPELMSSIEIIAQKVFREVLYALNSGDVDVVLGQIKLYNLGSVEEEKEDIDVDFPPISKVAKGFSNELNNLLLDETKGYLNCDEGFAKQMIQLVKRIREEKPDGCGKDEVSALLWIVGKNGNNTSDLDSEVKGFWKKWG